MQSTTPLIIVSGFLGAGKTTLINKLLTSALSPSETVLVENEFGEVAIDDELLSSSGMKTKTLASGCICCTLSASFMAELPKIVEAYHPKAIVIEPTGMAAPNDLLDICGQVEKSASVKITSLVSVINAQNFERYVKIDIPAFNRQFECLSLVVLTHVEGLTEDEIAAKKELIYQKAGAKVPVLAQPLDEIDGLELLAQAEQAFAESGLGSSDSSQNQEHDHACECDHDHDHEHDHEHHHHHHHDHDHSDPDEIVTKTFYPTSAFSDEKLQAILNKLESGECGTILRAKGFLAQSDDSMVLLEHVLGSGSIAPTKYAGEAKLVVIGQALDEQGLAELLEV